MESESKLTTRKKVLICILLSYLSFSIISEFFYREPLFKYSLSIEETIQKDTPKMIQKYLRLITKFGSKKTVIPIIAIVSLFIPINKTFTLIAVVFTSVYTDNIMKIIYSSPRPYWIDNKLNKYCDGSFGNPSGHAFLSSSFYLSLWHIITHFDIFSSNIVFIIFKYILLIVHLFLINSILFSRIYLGVHGLNQILYGVSLGIASYILYFYIFSIHSMKPSKFMKMINDIKIKLYSFFSLCIIFAILIFFFVSYQRTEEYSKLLHTICPKLKPYQYLNNDGLYDTLGLFGFIGVYSGILFTKLKSDSNYPEQEDYIINWQLGDMKRKSIRYITFFIFCFPYYLGNFISDNAHLALLFSIKISLCYFLTGFFMFGPGLYYGFMLSRYVLGVDPIEEETVDSIQPIYLEMNKQKSLV